MSLITLDIEPTDPNPAHSDHSTQLYAANRHPAAIGCRFGEPRDTGPASETPRDAALLRWGRVDRMHRCLDCRGRPMKWVVGGPNLPEELLQLLEDGRLVLFCGAGVSYPAGLPGFKGLVDRVYERTNQTGSDSEKTEYDLNNFDRVLGMLESRIGFHRVRRAVVDELRLDPSANLVTHRSIISLATNRDGVCRLVTTNFDRGFEFGGPNGIVLDAAPRLPVPKAAAWNSIVHLHGRICDADPEGRSLVMTSADFGSAYLTERWASRFLSDLFRRYAVLFVGYSVEDPVVRYMMDAFAADRALGEGVGKAFVLAGCTDGNDERDARAWQAKGVMPVLYDSREQHAALHQTLSKWAECHSHGLLGKESIVQEHAYKIPTRPFDQDPVVSQIVWALRERSGHVASAFARLDPAPPVEWLDVFHEMKLLALPCSVDAVGEPEGYILPLADGGRRTVLAPKLSPISLALGRWITRHLENRVVLDWALRAGAVLHSDFRSVIRQRLADGINMPAALRQLWRVLAGEANLILGDLDTFTSDLQDRLMSGEWDLQLKHDLLTALSPILTLRPVFHQAMLSEDQPDDNAVWHSAAVDLLLRCGESGRELLESINNSPSGKRVLADIADDATSLLSRAMELLEISQRAGPLEDWSYFDQPSIASHSQNSAFRQWTVLLELCRDSWLALLDEDSKRATRVVERWMTLPYPVFRRLCFFAMTESRIYSPTKCLDYMLEDQGRWIWSTDVYREKFRLLAAIWPKLSAQKAGRLISRIVSGPPKSKFRDDLSDEDFKQVADHEVWLHLLKLQRTGRPLPSLGTSRLAELSLSYPDWKIDNDDRSEFPIWTESGFGERPVENLDEFLVVSDNVISARFTSNEPQSDDLARWRRLSALDPARACTLLAAMARASVWKGNIWRLTLESLSAQKQILQQWPTLAPFLMGAPNAIIEELHAPLARCLKDVVSALEVGSPTLELFEDIWDRVQSFAFEDAPEEVSDPLTLALNTPSGHLTEALLGYVASMRPNQPSDVPKAVWTRLTLLTAGNGQSYKLARVLLASRLQWFYGLNPVWVEEYLLSFFNWTKSPEAPAVWQGFLWQPRITPELWPHIKIHFLAALSSLPSLGRSGEQLCQLFGVICVDRPEWLTVDEARVALRAIDGAGRAGVTNVVWRRLKGAGSQSEALWTDLIGPWLDRVWPKDLDLRDPATSVNLAIAATYTGSSFRTAVDAIAPFLVSAAHASPLWDRLLRAGFASREPRATLKLCGAIVDTTEKWPNRDLRKILDGIHAVDVSAAEQPIFRTLNEYLRKHDR